MKVVLAVLFSAVFCMGVPLSVDSVRPVSNNETNWAWNLPLAELSRDLARAAYCPENEILSWTCLDCGEDFVTKTVISEKENPNEIQGFVGHSLAQRLIVVAFRGSANEANWIANLKFDKIDSDFSDRGCIDCKIHRGFYECYGNVSAQVTKAVNELTAQFPTFSILTTGHSQGGALAVHAAVDLAVNHNYKSKISLVTFGEPRLGNENFAKFCISMIPKSTRIVHKGDLVPHMPPNEGPLDFDFHHEAREVWNIDDAFKVKICDESGEDDSCSKSVPVREWSVFDHLFYLGRQTGCTKDSISSEKTQELLKVQEDIKEFVLKMKK